MNIFHLNERNLVDTLLYLYLLTAVACMVQSLSLCGNRTSPAGYDKWTPPGTTRQDLYCPKSCLVGSTRDQRCCSCKSLANWEFRPCSADVQDLNIEYTSIRGNSSLLSETGNKLYSRVIHRHGQLSATPQNLCSWSNILEIDFSFNQIQNISSFSCLYQLNVLVLDYNKVTSINNKTFHQMTSLRKLSLVGNQIRTVEPNFLSIADGEILDVNLAYNKLESIDGIDFLREGPFCNLNYSHNSELKGLTNTLGFTVNTSAVYGPGDIDIEFSSFGIFPNYSLFGITDYTDLGHVLAGSMYVDGTSISCDCTLYPLLSRVGSSHILSYWPNARTGKMVCSSPEELKGVNMTEMLLLKDYDSLTCPVKNCPFKCLCFDEPHKGHVLVNCSNSGLTEMPGDMPIGYWNNNKLVLLLDDNSIEKLEDRNYLDRVKFMNLSGNNISYIQDSVIDSLPVDVQIVLTEHKNLFLPRPIQSMNPFNIEFGQQPVICNCSNTWVGNWIRMYSALGWLYCAIDGHTDSVPAENITDTFLGCSESDGNPLPPVEIAALVGLALALLSAIIIFCFRYELMLLLRMSNRKEYFATDETLHDVFISFDEDNPELFAFVKNQIRPRLQEAGHDVNIPFWNINGGDIIEEKLRDGISNSRNYIVIISDNYFNKPTTHIVMNTIWNYYKWNNRRKVIFLNFDKVEKYQMYDRRMRAFCRTGNLMDFTERETRMIERVERKIGPPQTYGQQVLTQTKRCNSEGKEELWQSEIPGCVPQNISDITVVGDVEKLNTVQENLPGQSKNPKLVTPNVYFKRRLRPETTV